MPPVQRASLNGIEMAYYEVGARGGVPVILCHGFPEIAFSWRHQLAAFAKAGVWAIAPDQRGYGLTSRPAAIAEYDMDHLTGDLVGLLDHLGVERAIFCGHDWGGIIAWHMPLMHPQRCAGVISLNTPFRHRGSMDPVEASRQAYGEDTYIVYFQKPGEADALLAQDVERTLRFIMRGPDPVAEDVKPTTEGGSSFTLKGVLDRYDPDVDDSQFLTRDELAVFVESFERSGFTGGLNWYRNFTLNWERSADLPTRVDGVPCLMIMAEKDAILTPAQTNGMENVISDLEKALVEGSGHWTQQEKPERVNEILLDWLGRRFTG